MKSNINKVNMMLIRYPLLQSFISLLLLLLFNLLLNPNIVLAEGMGMQALGEYIHADALNKEVEAGRLTMEEAQYTYNKKRYSEMSANERFEYERAKVREERYNRLGSSEIALILEERRTTIQRVNSLPSLPEKKLEHDNYKSSDMSNNSGLNIQNLPSSSTISLDIPFEVASRSIEPTSEILESIKTIQPVVITLNEILSSLTLDQTFSIQTKMVLGDLIRLEESLKGKNLFLKSGLPCKELNVAMDKLFPPIQFNPDFYKDDAHVKQLYSLASHTNNPLVAHYVILYQVYALHCDSIHAYYQLPDLAAGKITFSKQFLKLAYGIYE